jgi:hypothetical protein
LLVRSLRQKAAEGSSPENEPREIRSALKG